MLRRMSRGVLVLLLATGIAGCGDSDEGRSEERGAERAPEATEARGDLRHVDGTVSLEGDTVVVHPVRGGDELRLERGEQVDVGVLRALAASRARSRVYYRSVEDPVAVQVEAAPVVRGDASTFEGTVVKVSTTSLTIRGDDGTRRFEIRPADRAAFDPEHLEEHRETGEPVRVHYRTVDGSDVGVSYEDA